MADSTSWTAYPMASSDLTSLLFFVFIVLFSFLCKVIWQLLITMLLQAMVVVCVILWHVHFQRSLWVGLLCDICKCVVNWNIDRRRILHQLEITLMVELLTQLLPDAGPAQISYSHSWFSWKHPVSRDVKSCQIYSNLDNQVLCAFRESTPSTSTSVPKPLAFKGETYGNLIELLSKTGLKCRNFMKFFSDNDW